MLGGWVGAMPTIAVTDRTLTPSFFGFLAFSQSDLVNFSPTSISMRSVGAPIYCVCLALCDEYL